MGDIRFTPYHERVREASDPAAEIRALTDEGVICALAAASRERDPYLANVLATEALNRVDQKNAIISTAGEGLCALDREGRLTFMNPAAEQMLGWTFAELRGRSMYETIHPPGERGSMRPRGCCAPSLEGCCGNSVEDQEDVLTRKDGSSLPVVYTSKPIIRDGEVEGAVVVFRDVTVRKRAEDALRESELRFRQLADNISVVFWVGTADLSRVLYVNAAYERVWGRPREDLYADPMDWAKAIHPEDKARVLRAVEHAARDGTPDDEEFRITRPDGTTRWIHDLAIPLRDEAGEVYRLAGIAEDVTERKRAEESLRESEEKYRLLVQNVNDIVYHVAVDPDAPSNWRVEFVNDQAERVLGYTPRELRRGVEAWNMNDWLRFFHPDDVERVAEANRALVQTKKPVTTRYRVLHKRTGEYRWIEDRAVPEADATGRVVGILGILRDATKSAREEAERARLLERERAAREEAEHALRARDETLKALRESQARYKALAIASAQIVWTSKPGGRLEDLPDWHAYTGQTPHESQGWGWLEAIHPDDRERTVSAWTRAFETGTLFDTEYRLRRTDGEYRWFAVRGVPIPGEDGQVREWVGTLTDITKRKRAEGEACRPNLEPRHEGAVR